MLGVFAVCIGGLTAAGVYLLLRRSLVKLLFGVALLSHAANLLIFALGGGLRGRAPIVPEGASVPDGATADPVSQALVLTAIVIGFGIIAFLAALLYRAAETTGELDADRLTEEAP